jgi:predicted 2-oxoglutarate/Fe(II)-dependent dioxygenase YbiX
VRTIFNPLWADDIFGLRDVFMRMIAMRNMLVGKPPTYASTTIEDGLWTAARLQHYPTGGGFMSAHVDQMVVDAVSSAGLEHVQLLLILTKKGEDYERGGGFTVKDGKFIDVEQFCELGDIVVYDSRILHGVDTVDPHKRLDLDTPMAVRSPS